MDIELSPPTGVAPVRLGMGFEEAVEASNAWGPPQVSGPFSHDPTVKIITSQEAAEFEVVVHLEDSASVTAIEIWRFRNESADTHVHWGEVDIFRTPAREVLRHLAGKGYEIDLSDTDSPVVPGLTLAFTRETDRDVPRDEDGHTLYFESVLMADENYYDDLD